MSFSPALPGLYQRQLFDPLHFVILFVMIDGIDPSPPELHCMVGRWPPAYLGWHLLGRAGGVSELRRGVDYATVEKLFHQVGGLTLDAGPVQRSDGITRVTSVDVSTSLEQHLYLRVRDWMPARARKQVQVIAIRGRMNQEVSRRQINK